MPRSVRPSTEHGKAASARSESRVQPSRSPSRQRTTRSQSRDLGANNVDASVNTGSNAGITDRRGDKRSSEIVAAAPDLSVVEEDEEVDEEVNEANGDSQDDAVDDDHSEDQIEELGSNNESLPSLGELGAELAQNSQPFRAMPESASTATAAAEEIDSLDTSMIVDLLPDLLQSARQVMQLLVPTTVTQERVQATRTALLFPGSTQGQKLKLIEDIFQRTAGSYTTVDIPTTPFPFLETSSIMTKLFGSKGPGLNTSRPDAIIYAANLAFLTKGVFVLKPEREDAYRDLQLIEDVFPTAFLSEFSSNAHFGSSALRKDSFQFGLELRTQIAIAVLQQWRESPDFDPSKLLSEIFYESSSNQVRGMAGFSSDDHEDRISTRYQIIESTFSTAKEEGTQSEPVDFETLEAEFPWTAFVTVVATWARKRYLEITKSISQQGEVQDIVNALERVVAGSNGQQALDDQSPTSSAASLSAQDNTAARKMITAVAYLKNRYKRIGERPPIALSTTKALHTPERRLTASGRATEPAKITEEMRQQAFDQFNPAVAVEESNDGFEDEGGLEASPILGGHSVVHSKTQPNNSQAGFTSKGKVHNNAEREIFDDDEIDSQDPEPEYIQKVVSSWNDHSREKNKENRPLPSQSKKTKRPVGKQPNTARDQRSQSPSDDDASRSFVSPSGLSEHEDDEESEDQGFEQDQRPMDISRRTAPRNSNIDSGPSSHGTQKRARTSTLDAEERPRKMARREASPPPPSTYREVISTARMEGARAKMASFSASQRRVPWSEADTSLLVEAIGQWGCAWAHIRDNVEFEHYRDNIALKDKARNMKVAFLRSHITGNDLPANFENVRLDKKGLEAVRKVLGEDVDENGNRLV
ncbi:hypothetical protein PVAG01_02860 [Phlyctema vagabunda]|uniref:Myb-like domain-containing protein n=1 Tax=Phlyctema vagabunda TaxID=108571 RepID=A0ABR4PS24_9HELO